MGGWVAGHFCVCEWNVFVDVFALKHSLRRVRTWKSEAKRIRQICAYGAPQGRVPEMKGSGEKRTSALANVAPAIC